MEITINVPSGAEINFNMTEEEAMEFAQKVLDLAGKHKERTDWQGCPESQEQEPEEGKEADAQPKGYKGFLLMKCEKCGKIKGYCAKIPVAEHRCDCGHRTKITSAKRAYLNCECGDGYRYLTNVTDEIFEYPCINCGNIVDLRYNKRHDAYFTIRE